MGNREPVEDLPGSVRNPLPEMRDRHSPAADMVKRMKADPETMAEVLQQLQHLQVIRRTAEADPPPGNNLQKIFNAFWAIGSGGWSKARFVFLVVLTTLKQIAKMEGEIPKEQCGKVEKRNRNLEQVEKNTNRVEQDVGNMKETIERAAEDDDFRISFINNKKLEMALVTAQSHFRSCQDGATDVREANSGLQLAAKSALLVTGAKLAAALIIALCCFYWTGPLIIPNQNDDDDDVNTKMITNSAMIIGFLFVGVVTFFRLSAQNLFNNKKLWDECKTFQNENLQSVDDALKVLKRDIELVVDLKEKLDVVDIIVSRYASFRRRPHWE